MSVPPLFAHSFKQVYLTLFIALVMVSLFSCAKEEAREPRVLVFSKTMGYRHESIPAGAAAIMKLGEENGFKVDTTENAEKFTENNLKKYSAVIFLNTTQNVLDFTHQSEFERYIQSGGGFVGLHAAADTEYDWPWYGKLVGAYFESHPEQQNATVRVIDQNHPATEGLPAEWKRFDEWYNFKNINPEIKVLAKVDEKTYKGGKNGDNHPFAWYHAFDGGRAFYTAGGHTADNYQDKAFLKHLLGGIKYAMGDSKPLNYNVVKTTKVPEPNRFSKTVLAEKLDEPMELAVAKDGHVFFVERKGKLKMYDPTTQKTTVVGEVPVNTKYNGGKEAEDGLLGIALDPAFESNRQIYLFYSPAGSIPKQHVSRFTLSRDNQLDLKTEKVVIQIPTQRDECCHSGGSLAFDRYGDLYISTGDNTNPFASSGYSPSDERPGRSAWDAQKSSANMNDLRGKILRIHVEKDGSYTIPNGNLFPADGSKGRPEIYVMGCRNPYRIAIDSKRNFLYWGDVGPDAGKDSIQGPRGHDEVNQARKAGFFGWPYFVGDNKAYKELNFATGEVGAAYDPKAPINNSPNNTGGQQLPPAQKAFIYYPYADSPDFPDVGKGGRTAMAGPTYYFNDYNTDSEVKFPEYYDGALFIYEWMRGWIMAVRLNENGDFVRMEQVAPQIKLEKPSDMQFGSDGAMYLLEYGTNWFAANEDSKLVKIEFTEGNRAPIVIADASNKVGAAPLTVKFTSEGTVDYDGDPVSYDWRFNGQRIGSHDPNPEFTYDKPGIYTASLTVTDSKGRSSSSNVEIQVGNSMPVLTVHTSGNTTFFWDNAPVDYQVEVTDKEDGSLKSGSIEPSKVKVYMDYLPQGKDMIEILGHQTKDAAIEDNHPGLQMINKSDCRACHAIDKKSIGPAYIDVAKRYSKEEGAVAKLANKVIKGGGGNWGEQAMSAHPQLSVADASTMVSYILTLADEKKAKPSLDPQGSFVANQHVGKGDEGTYIISAYYTDKGGKEVGPLMSKSTLILRHPKLQAEDYDAAQGVSKAKIGNDDYVRGMRSNSYISFKNIDLKDIDQITYNYAAKDVSGKLEMRIDSPKGKVVSTADITPGQESTWKEISTAVSNPGGKHDLYFVFTNNEGTNGTFNLNWIYFQNSKMNPAKTQQRLSIR